MLVTYSPISSLTSDELADLKRLISHLTLEGRGDHFIFRGKAFSIAELRRAKQVWESEARQANNQPLFE